MDRGELTTTEAVDNRFRVFAVHYDDYAHSWAKQVYAALLGHTPTVDEIDEAISAGHNAHASMRRTTDADRDRFLAELGWREFAHHVLHHYPRVPDHNLDPRFDDFPWAAADEPRLEAWRRGRTGVPIVDAGMRELWHTGWMHHRVRMVVASWLTKHLRQHWLHGARWFWDTLLDANLANNTQGWQWTAGTGADAAPYFRVFNPVSQARRFDPEGAYIARWVPELARLPLPARFAPWEHPELARRVAPGYPARPQVDLAAGRAAALAAFAALRGGRAG